MSERHEQATPQDVAELESVALVLCTSRNFPRQLGPDCASARMALGLPATGPGCALVLTQDAAGACWTVITSDLEHVKTAQALAFDGIEYSYMITPDEVLSVRPGWAVACTTALADRPAPHDPPTG